MRYRRLAIVLTVALALCATSCASYRAVSEREEVKASVLEVRDTVKEVVTVELRDTLQEVTTVTVLLRERPAEASGLTVGPPDTVKVTTVTDRFRGRDRVQASAVKEKLVVRTDTVYVEKASDEKVVAVGPGVEVKADGTVTAGCAGFRSTLKWLFFVIVAVIVLIIVVRLGRKGILL